jgi:predicted NBD/HSP70 family sugar kinase
MVSVHELNRSKILQTLFFHAPISRTEIANIVSLTPPAITSNIALLMEAGIVEKTTGSKGKQEIVLGRRRIQLDIVPSAFYAIGVDWGPCGIICSISNLRGTLIDQASDPQKDWEPTETIAKTARMINTLLDKNRLSKEKILGVGIGVPGFIETETGLVRYAPAYGWQNVSMGPELAALTGLSVVLENNVRMMAVGKVLFDRYRMDLPTATDKNAPSTVHRAEEKTSVPGNFLFIFVGPGIACAIVHNNELLRGNVFGAGELGHTTVALDGPQCRCGKKGCLEAIASEFALKKQVRAAISDSGDRFSSIGVNGDKTNGAILRAEVQNPNDPTIREILAAWDKGDVVTDRIVSECITYLALGTANVINLINPELVIFAGRIFENARLCEKLRETINDHTFALMKSETDFEFLKYREDFGSISGAAYAITQYLL